MEIEDEINQINSIINKLDVIRDDEWQKKEDETEEEFDNRLETIEEELEEELLDYISDSLLAEQEINEEEAIKEAQEKIKADYELFSDAFIKSDNGIITLKSEEELMTLGYDTPEEVEKLNSIAENINSPEIYINKIKDSIHASKDIDAEIDRKMELAKTIIAAKKRGETLPSSLNPSIEKDKFEKANAYIANTTTLRKVPFVQNEYINNNYIAERKYNNVIRNITTNTTTKSTSGRTATTNTTSQATTPVISATETKIVTRKIPERKNTLYTNFEKKLDKSNDLTKQKIKARTELKSIFKQIEDKELSKEEMEDLNSKIESIKKKYPNTITEKNLKKLFDTFKVKLPTIEQEHTNIGEDNGNELNELKHELNESLKDINEHSEIDVDDDKQKNDRLKGQGEKIVTSIEEVQKEPKTTEIKAPHKTSPKKNRTTDIALGALAVGEAIGTTIGTIKQKSEEKIEHLKKKGEEVVQNISQQQKKAKKENTVSTKSKKEAKKKKEKVEKTKTETVPAVQTPIDSVNDKKKKKTDGQPVVEPKIVIPKAKMSKEELLESLKKAETHSSEYIHAKGINLLIINKLICYLRDNNDPEIQERLNREIEKLQTDRHNSTDELYIYNPKKTNIQTLQYMYDSYKNGVRSTDGSRDIISVDPNAAAYYLYLANNVAQTSISSKNEKEKEISKEIKNEFESKKEDTCYRYFEFLKGKYNIDGLNGIDRIKAEYRFIKELEQARQINERTEYLELAIAREFISRPRKNNWDISDEKDFKEKIKTLQDKLKNGEKLNPRILKLLGNMYYNGLQTVVGESVVVQDVKKAKEMFEEALNTNGLIDDYELYEKLIAIYSDNKLPFFNEKKADELSNEVTKKGLKPQKKKQKSTKIKPSVYICSDLHGEFPAYKSIISQLKGNDKLYILGDVIDRGPDGIKILQDIIQRKEKGQVEFLIGNHELMMIQTLFLGDKKQEENWTSKINQGRVTKDAFEKLSANEQNKIKEFLFNSYVYKNINVNSNQVHLVHAKSIQDKNDSTDKTVKEMIDDNSLEKIIEATWDRDKDGESPHKNSAKAGIFTIIGHSPTKNNMIQYKNGYLDIDCGSSRGEIASLVNLTSGRTKYFSVRHEREKESNKQHEK